MMSGGVLVLQGQTYFIYNTQDINNSIEWDGGEKELLFFYTELMENNKCLTYLLAC